MPCERRRRPAWRSGNGAREPQRRARANLAQTPLDLRRGAAPVCTCELGRCTVCNGVAFPPHVREGPGRQPRRDRRPGHPRAATSSASPRSPSTPRSTATRCTSRAPTRRTCSGGPTAAESYLNVERILEVARESGAEAIHPGYGFLAENAAFARACEEAGIVFIGPPASAIDAMGSKTRARELMRDGRRADRARHDRAGRDRRGRAARSSTTRSATRSRSRPRAAAAARASASRSTEDELQAAFEGAAREGEKFFSDATVYLERYLPDPRHVEVQVLADRHGNTIHLGERDCSVQRRHQKLIEESPAPARRRGAARADREDRRRGRARRRLRRRRDDRGAALRGRRVLLPRDEHPRPGRALRDRDDDRHRHRQGGHPRRRRASRCRVGQDDVVLRGHAIECRINAEDASKNFAPAPGRIGGYREPAGPGRARRLRRRRRAARSRRCTTRWSPSSSSGTPTASRRRGACCARWPSTRSRASRR